jgi:hypothetical protein
MKVFTKALLLCSFLALGTASNTYSTNYVSAGAGPADWSAATTWTPNGHPLSTDNVTILAGHQVNISTASNVCRNLTISGILNWTANVAIVVYGDYVVNASGSESAPVFGKITFNPPGTILNIAGTSSPKLYYNFNSNRTLTGTFNKTSAFTQIAASKTVTNLGTYIMGNITPSAGSVWINGANSSLSLRLVGFMSGHVFTANASGNTVILTYATGAIPTTTAGFYNLTLSSATSGTKTLPANTIIGHNLTMNVNNSLNSNNFDLSVGGNWVNNATFTASVGKTVTFNGTSAQTVSNSVGTTTFKRLAVSNNMGVTLTSGTYILDEVLTISNGTFNTGGRSFTMTSNAAQTARIAPITGTGAIAGNFTIQRFITTRDSTYADLSSPVQNSTFVDWDNELPAIYYGQYPTQYTYDEAADYFSPVQSSGTALTPGQGFEVFLTGDFSYANLPNTTINTIGVPNQSDQDLSGLISFNGAGSNLVGNPFASSISWSSVFAASSGILNTYDMYDYTAGNYTTFGLGTEIGSTQGFWVYTTTPAATLLIPESAKTVSANSSVRASIQEPYFTLKLSGNDAGNHFFHVLKVNTDMESSDGWDNNDHPYRKSPNKLAPSMYTFIDGKKAVINSFSPSDDNFSMPVVINIGTNGYYKIEASGFENVSDYSCIKLEDKMLNKMVDLTSDEAYSFQVNVDDRADRFVVHFSKSGSCRSFVAANNTLGRDLESMVTVLPTSEGNSIAFNMTEATPATVTVTNVLGQDVIAATSVLAASQTINIAIPQDFSGMYILKIESSKGVITKKYVRK